MNPSLLPWAACLVVSVVAPICGAAWLLVHRLHARSKNSVIDSGNSLIASVSLFLVGAFAIVAPIAFLSEEGLAGVLTATYYVLELVTIQLINVGEAAVLDSMGAFGYVYYCVLEAYRRSSAGLNRYCQHRCFQDAIPSVDGAPDNVS